MISKEEARQKAAKGLRFDFGGTIPYLGQQRYSEEDGVYIFSIVVSYLRLPDKMGEDMNFDEPTMVGEIIIDESTGNMHHTPSDIISNRVGEIKNNGKVIYSED